MFAFGQRRARRRASLTPMIDVVFLLLVFFMLASRFGSEAGLTLAVANPGQGAAWSGPPRLVEIAEGGALWLNGVPLAPEALAGALAALMQRPGDAVVLRARDGAEVQDLVSVAEALHAAGLTRLMLVQAP
ncbi:MAG: biopolymer transporter ExbD [Phaeovulum sp.]|uniref:ExbD/TolR family protein n=1 Tax=Phaeovulum sp. TaxID=2934796 RepID=UPI00272FB547|nr:biopolymer transporter ExbD [Phaeovulum sp.]MDP2062521.1 biopolymer transporter ExbD [Phaeovulum sp.]